MSIELDRRAVLTAGIATGLVGALTPAAHAATAATLVPLPKPNSPVLVAVMMDERATMIDFAGPWEAFQDAGVANVPGFELYTVAPSKEPIHTTGNGHGAARPGMRVIPDFTFTDAPQPKVVIMGAQSRADMPEKIEWIKKVAPACDIVMSVCTGAFLLARTGLIDGLSATTHHDYYERFEKAFKDRRITLLKDRRFVDNGKFITAGGLTSGVDGALHVVARYYGVDAARKSAAYMEHNGEGWLSGMRHA
jgi:transcriptional regulator GlxA family with amidase domain